MSASRSLAALDIPVLRVVRRGDRHAVHDMSVDVRVELDSGAPHKGSDTVLNNAVRALAAQHAGAEPERFAGVVAQHCANRIAGARRTQVDVCMRGWDRLAIGGRPLDRELIGPNGNTRVGRAVIEGSVQRIAGGFRNMMLLTSVSEQDTRVAVISLDALWYYGWSEVPFDPQWQQVRRALTEAYAERAHRVDGELATALARAVLDESPAVQEIEVKLEIVRRSAIDLTEYGMDPAGDVFGASSGGRGVHVVIQSRELPVGPA
jgi:urate oxidase